MKAIKIVAIVMLVYVGIVVTFESLLGYFQPENQRTLIITTTSESGERNERVLARLVSNEKLYVAANHWPRAWYNQVLANPDVQVILDGVSGNYSAVPVSGEEHNRINAENELGIVIRFLTGFPPRYFVRLEPK